MVPLGRLLVTRIADGVELVAACVAAAALLMDADARLAASALAAAATDCDREEAWLAAATDDDARAAADEALPELALFGSELEAGDVLPLALDPVRWTSCGDLDGQRWSARQGP